MKQVRRLLHLLNRGKATGDSGGGTSWITTFLVFIAEIESITTLFKSIYARFNKQEVYRIYIEEGSYFFNFIMDEIRRRYPIEMSKSIILDSSYNPEGEFNAELKKIIFHKAVVKVKEIPRLVLDIDGIKVTVYTNEEGRDKNAPTRSTDFIRTRNFFVLEVPTYEQSTELIEIVGHLLAQQGERQPTVFSWRWSEWNRSMKMAPRRLDQVYLPNGVINDLINDIDKWKANKDFYNKLGLPYRRSYMLSGIPGSGKTSLVRAIAFHYGMDIYYVSLSSMAKDDALEDLIHSIPARAIVLIEDIDSYHAAVNREQENEQVTSAGLLNALDGIGTPEELMFFITTNHAEKLDNALIRTGRVDYHIEFEGATKEQLRDFWRSTIGGKEPKDLDKFVGRPTSDFAEHIRRLATNDSKD